MNSHFCRTALSHIQLQGVQIKKNAIDGARGMVEGAKRCEQSLGGKTRKRPLGRPRHAWRGILKKSDRRPKTGLLWFRIGRSGGLL